MSMFSRTIAHMAQAFAVVAVYCVVGSSGAFAVCRVASVTSASISVAPATTTLSTAHAGVPATLTINYTRANGASTACLIAVKISGSLIKSGGATMPYTIATASGGTPVISFTTTHGSTASFTPAVGATSTTLAVFMVIPNGVYASGLFADATGVAQIFSTNGVNLLASGAVTPTVNYTANTCTIGGSASGGTQSVDFSSGSSISIGQKSAAFGAVTCNSPATVTLSSANGAATATGAAGTTHQNFFDYVASTTVNGAAVSLDTSANPARGAAESASASIVANTTTNATLSIGITPKAPAKPLVAGSYSDILTVTITAN